MIYEIQNKKIQKFNIIKLEQMKYFHNIIKLK